MKHWCTHIIQISIARDTLDSNRKGSWIPITNHIVNQGTTPTALKSSALSVLISHRPFSIHWCPFGSLLKYSLCWWSGLFWLPQFLSVSRSFVLGALFWSFTVRIPDGHHLNHTLPTPMNDIGITVKSNEIPIICKSDFAALLEMISNIRNV